MKNQKSKFKKIIWSLILLISAFILYLFFKNAENRLLIKNYYNDFFSKKQENIVEITKEDEIKNQVIDTTNWKIYEDNLYDFKIKYPNSWADPQVQVINDKNLAYQYKVNFGTIETLNGNDDDGFFVFVSKKKILEVTKNECNYTYNKKDNLDQEISPLNFFSKPKKVEDYTTCYSYQFMGQNFEYKLVPMLNNNQEIFLIEINGLNKFESAKNTFIIDFENIQKKAIEQEKARKIAEEKARQARLIAAEKARQARLRSCPKENDDPGYSKTKGKHMDEDCCPDPDEWANPKCRYSDSGYRIMIKR